jgi:flagellar hook-associated protein FlgK
MKVINDILDLFLKFNNKFEELIQDLTNKINMLEKKVDINWTVATEEINDMYPAIKAINTEIMYLKNKNE